MTLSLQRCADCPLDRVNHQELHVGITGHRPHRLPADLRPLVQKITAVWRWIVPGGVDVAPQLHIWSALAEGVDRLAIAAEVVEQPYRLHAVLPCEQTLYEDDFSPENSLQRPGKGTVDEFRHILSGNKNYTSDVNPEPVVDRTGAENHYVLAGEKIVSACDLLLAVYDGGQRAAGGAGDVVLHAQRQNKPTITINPFTLETFYQCGKSGDRQPVKSTIRNA